MFPLMLRFVTDGQIVEELSIPAVTVGMNIWVLAFTDALGTVEYSWDGPSECGGVSQECRACATYSGCESDAYPQCDGSGNVRCLTFVPTISPSLMSKMPSTTPIIMPTSTPTTKAPTATIVCEGEDYYAFPGDSSFLTCIRSTFIELTEN